MTTSIPQPSYTWTVTSSRADTTIGANGQVQTGVTLDFAVDDPPVTGSVFIPNERKGQLDYVKGQIAAEAAQLAALATLTSES